LKESGFSLDIPIAIFDERSRAQVLGSVDIFRDLNGKPYRRLGPSEIAGVSFTHVRQARPPFSLMALCDDPHIGIDAEVWPLGPADPVFLASVASPEDQAFLARIAVFARDPARALWVVKEAALKATGDVMIDPLDLAVEVSRKGHIRVSTARKASAPSVEIQVQVFQLKSNNVAATTIVAVAALFDLRILFSAPGWHIDSAF
jgi:phosphopantetheinyl transferase